MAKNLISIKNVKKQYTDKILLENVTFGIHQNEKIGLLGKNGTGKSTLLKIIFGEEKTDEGFVNYRNNLKIHYLPQDPKIKKGSTIFDHIYYSDKPEFKLLREYSKIVKKMETDHSPAIRSEFDKILSEMDAKDAWKIENKAKSFLTKFGFKDFDKSSDNLSGGEKRRIDLARVLMDEPDVLLLDEPTNHLDVNAIEWLQDYLNNFKGVVVFVTHDRYFLNHITTKIVDIDNKSLNSYSGNYSDYLEAKELQIVDLNRKETRRKSQLKKELKWLRRGARARATKAKSHLDKVKELMDKSYLVQKQDLDISFQNKRLGKKILELKKISKSFGDNKLFNDFSHVFQKKERIGLIGPNGCGKTTFLKIFMGEIKPTSGKVENGKNTSFAYFKQSLNEFDEDETLLDCVNRTAPNIRTKDGVLHSAEEMLLRFLFDKKQQRQKIKTLSGGEKKRLHLLKSLIFGNNFLVLDEPTNDLDLPTLEILEDFLDAYDGCVVVVSHDRFFLDRVTDHLFIFEKEGIRKFPGNYSDYYIVNSHEKEKQQTEKKIKKTRPRAKKNFSYKHKLELSKLEKEIHNSEEKINEIEIKIENEASNLDYKDFQKLSNEKELLEEELFNYMERWEFLEDLKEKDNEKEI